MPAHPEDNMRPETQFKDSIQDLSVPPKEIQAKDDSDRMAAAVPSATVPKPLRSALPGSDIDIESGDGTELKRKPLDAIPRRKRRGLLAQLVIWIPEIDDPLQYSNNTKHFIVFIIAMAGVAAPMGYFNAIFLITIALRFIFRRCRMLSPDYIQTRIWRI